MKGLKTILAHPLILGSLGAVAVIALGSALYYSASTRVPTPPQSVATSTTSLTASGTVEPSQNPNLAFESGGRVARVVVAVGSSVTRGQLLASLDTAALSAQRAQAVANVNAQQAKLDGLLGGARPEDIAASQAALDKATQDLANMYGSVGDTSIDSYTKANDAVRNQLDQLFSNDETDNPQLTYTVANFQAQNDTEAQRRAASVALNAWQAKLTNLALSNAGLEALVQEEISYVAVIRQLLSSVSATLDASPGLSAATVASYRADVSAAQSEVNTAGKNLTGVMQNISSQTLTVAQLQAQLALKRAGSLPSDIAAQQAQVAQAEASVSNIDAQIQNAIVVAPFSGTVASVHVKVGDIVTQSTPAVSLNPESALQIIVYFSEIDITKIKAGEQAQVTLDAYGNARVFDAQVVSVDTSPTQGASSSALGYKATLQFLKSDPAISSGMTANVTIPIAQ